MHPPRPTMPGFRTRRDLIERGLPLLLAVLPALWFAAPLLHKTPLSIDHPTHLFKAWHFWHEMLGRGRLRGWSDFWAFGFPSDELVPFGGEAWVALSRTVTLGLLPWTRTYALAFGAFLVLQAASVYSFARPYFGTVAAVLASWITSLDPGAMLQGGWHWHTFYGVWPVSLSMCFSLFALVRLRRVLLVGRMRDVAGASLWFGAALLTHAMALLVLAVSAPLLLLDAQLSAENKCKHAGRFVGAVALGFAVAGFYLVPFLASSAETQDVGWLGDPLAEVSRRFVELRTFTNVSPLVHALAIVGAIFAVRRRREGDLFIVLAAGIFVLLGSDAVVNDLRLWRVFPSINKIEFTRFVLVAKLFWFPLAGFGAVSLWRRSRSWAPGFLRWPWHPALGFLLALALVIPGFGAIHDEQITKTFQGEEETPLWGDMQSFWQWSKGLREEPNERYRIAYHMYRGNHLSTVSPVFDGRPIYKVGYTPAQVFDNLPMTDENEIFEESSVKYVVSSYDLDRPNLAFERSFGELRVYRLTTYRKDPFTLLGQGEAELLEREPERIRIRLRGTNAESRIRLHVASFPRWRARIGNEALPISAVPVFGAEYPFLMEMPASDGELTLTYVYRPSDWAGLLLTIAAVPVAAFFVWIDRRRKRPWPEFGSARLRTLALLGTGAGAVAFVVVRLANGQVELPSDSLFYRLSGSDMRWLDQPCNQEGKLAFRCGSEQVRADVVSGGAWGVHYCMTAEPTGALRIRAPLEAKAFLEASYDPPKDVEGKVRVSVNGEELGAVPTRPAYYRKQRLRFDTRAFRGTTATFDISLEGAALHCFDLRLVR